ncbi:2708_t:CDS:2, partial [Cetraspora pellucida]
NEEMEKKTQALTNLQTQLDMETKTKEQLAKELQKEKVGEWFEKVLGSLRLKTDTEFYHQYKEAEEYNKNNYDKEAVAKEEFEKLLLSLFPQPDGIDCVDIPTETTEISELGEQLKETNLEEKGETSLQAQIETPPKNN